MKNPIIKISLLLISCMFWAAAIFAQEKLKPLPSLRHICVKGDYSSEKPGICPEHGQALVQGNELSTRTSVEANVKIPIYKEFTRFICVKGDVSQTNGGICPNHQLPLLSSNDTKAIQTSREEWKKEMTLKKIEVPCRHICVKGDFSSEKEGKCPKHGINLSRSDDETVNGNIVAETK
jgi:hypothetical protein